jgi:hypothetical protein
MFVQWLWNPGINTMRAGETGPTGFTDLDTDTIKAALYNDSITPNHNVAVGETGYNAAAGVWDSGEQSDGTNWDAGGEPVVPTGDGLSNGTNFIMFDAADTSQSGASTTLASVFGCLVYDDSITAGTVADQGICFNYFGGSQSVTGGTFTIVWHANGVFRFTL